MIELIDTFRDARVLCVGDLMLDRFVVGQVDRISPEGPVPVFLTRRTATMLGGVGNVARNVASLGGEVALVAVVGADAHAALAQGLVDELGAGSGSLIADATRSTIVKTRFVAAGQQLLRVDEEQVHDIDPAIEDMVVARCAALLPSCGAVVLSDYAKGVLTDRLLQRVIELARAHGRPVVVDPKSRRLDRYAGASVVTPNVKELAQIVGGPPCETDAAVEAAASGILADGVVDALVVTRSEKGMTLVTRDGRIAHKRATAQEVFDVSGAGDTVVATLG
ncbi:MAG: bifunctional heptose 7-phosphate kinase/heptose 1-phosphate adenyltransferase, partial [Pseudomonadota bacterium]